MLEALEAGRLGEFPARNSQYVNGDFDDMPELVDNFEGRVGQQLVTAWFWDLDSSLICACLCSVSPLPWGRSESRPRKVFYLFSPCYVLSTISQAPECVRMDPLALNGPGAEEFGSREEVGAGIGTASTSNNGNSRCVIRIFAFTFYPITQ